jgi:DMSO/TMAO reductase YedYZ molybdopterin-dependent catalytic subunit
MKNTATCRDSSITLFSSVYNRRVRCTNMAVGLTLASLVLIPSPTQAQTSVLIVDGEVETRLTLSLDHLRAMSRQRIEVEDRGARATYEGVPLTEILRRAGVAIGRAPLQGRALTSILFVTAPDGFRAIFALAELDPASGDDRVLLADTRDGLALSAKEGPLRVVAPGDKYPARWVRNVTRITVVGVMRPTQN